MVTKRLGSFGHTVTADIASWSLDMETDKIERGPYVAGPLTESGAVTMKTATIAGFWGPEDAICIACRRYFDTDKERFATATTDTDPAEYIGVVCRECVLKALEGVE